MGACFALGSTTAFAGMITYDHSNRSPRFGDPKSDR